MVLLVFACFWNVSDVGFDFGNDEGNYGRRQVFGDRSSSASAAAAAPGVGGL